MSRNRSYVWLTTHLMIIVSSISQYNFEEKIGQKYLIDQRGSTYSERRTTVIEPGQGQLHAVPHVRTIFKYRGKKCYVVLKENFVIIIAVVEHKSG